MSELTARHKLEYARSGGNLIVYKNACQDSRYGLFGCRGWSGNRCVDRLPNLSIRVRMKNVAKTRKRAMFMTERANLVRSRRVRKRANTTPMSPNGNQLRGIMSQSGLYSPTLALDDSLQWCILIQQLMIHPCRFAWHGHNPKPEPVTSVACDCSLLRHREHVHRQQ